MKIYLLLLLAFVSLISLFPSTELACACCAERGHYSIRTAKFSGNEAAELLKLKFETAELYTDAGYPETIKGINPLGESFSVEGLLNGKVWTFAFKDNNQKTGKLDLAKPLSMVEYMVDLPGGEENESAMVRLYKEWRFKYKIQNATGIFKNGFASANEYFLVLQGYGNVCTSAEDFTKWRLEVSGRKADFKFFGKLSASN